MSKWLFMVGLTAIVAVAFLLATAGRKGAGTAETGQVDPVADNLPVQGRVARPAHPEEAVSLAPERGPGWRGEDLHAGAKTGNSGCLTNLYDYDRGLAERPKPYPLSAEIAEAETSGADFRISFLVRDRHGAPVEGATVVVGAFQRGPAKTFEGTTDGNGVATVSGFGTGELLVTVAEASHHEVSFRHGLYDPRFECAKDGRWFPWNPLLPVTLPEKGEGLAAAAYDVAFTVPNGECEIGVDLVRGEVAKLESFRGVENCVLTFSRLAGQDDGGDDAMTLSLDFKGEGSGGIVVKRDPFCSLPWPPEAPEAGYEKRLGFAWCPPRVPCPLPRTMADDVIVFRVRGDDGRFRHGVIERPLSETGEGRHLSLCVTVNEIPDSRNLEPAPGRNPVVKSFRLAPGASFR